MACTPKAPLLTLTQQGLPGSLATVVTNMVDIPSTKDMGIRVGLISNPADMLLGQRSSIISLVLTSCWIVCQKHKRAASTQHRWQLVPHAKVQHSIEQKWQRAVLRGC